MEALTYQTPLVTLADRQVDLIRQLVVFPGGRTASLTTREAQLLAYLAARAEKDVERDELLEQVWCYRATYATRAVDVTMRRLRAKVEPDPQNPIHLISVHGVGYRFVPVPLAAPTPPVPVPVPGRPNGADRAPFVGRVAERATLRDLILCDRLVSVLGPGGIGKSRLVGEVVDDLGPAPAWWVELETAEGLPGVVAAVAAALGVVLTGGEGQMAAGVGRALAGRGPTLVVLDAFERHVGWASDTVGAWLAAAPQTTVVVTSRQRLRLVGERVYELPPLDPADARALFRERVSASGVEVAEGQDAALDRLVDRLDRLPLAIELAAPRARMMSLDALQSRLDERFKLLGTSSRDGRTLEAVLDASWELLTEDERRALTFCGAFVGGFALEAAEAVLDDLGGWPLDLVEALRDKSLLRVIPTSDAAPDSDAADAADDPGEPRLGLYDSVRDYALQKLAERGDTGVAFQRHAAYVVPICEELAETVDRHGGRQRMVRLASEADNLLAVVRRPTSEPAEVVRAVLALEPLYATRGPIAVLRRLLDDALPIARDLGDDRQHARLLLARANVHRLSGENEAGVAEAERALALVRGTRSPVETRACSVLALLHSDATRHELARATAEEGLAVARASGHRALEGAILGMVAALAMMRGDGVEAERRFLDAIRIDQDVGNELRAAIDLANFGLLLSEAGRADEAEDRLVAALELHRAWGNLRGTATCHTNLGTLRAQQGRFEEALQHTSEAERLFRGGGYHTRFAALAAENGALLRWALHGPADAVAALGAVVDELTEVDDHLLEGMGRAYLACALACTADPAATRQELDRAVALLTPLHNVRADGLLGVARGFVALARARAGDASGRPEAERAREEGGRSELFGVRFLSDRLAVALEAR